MVGSLFSIVFPVVAFLGLQRHFVRALNVGIVK